MNRMDIFGDNETVNDLTDFEYKDRNSRIADSESREYENFHRDSSYSRRNVERAYRDRYNGYDYRYKDSYFDYPKSRNHNRYYREPRHREPRYRAPAYKEKRYVRTNKYTPENKVSSRDSKGFRSTGTNFLLGLALLALACIFLYKKQSGFAATAFLFLIMHVMNVLSIRKRGDKNEH